MLWSGPVGMPRRGAGHYHRRVLDVKRLGEFGLIDALRERAGRTRAPWTRGIGDDAAILRPRAGRDLVLTSDALIEDVHFRWSTTDARSLGHKALAASLSDLGAMGADPLGCLLTLGLPADAPADRLDALVRGLLALATRSGCPLVGGDTVRAGAWTIAITAVGEVPHGKALLRSGARPGDRILVTGDLGGSELGLRLLELGQEEERGARPFVRRHRRPDPPWAAGARLRRAGGVSAAIDLSDGLLQDLEHVLQASEVGAVLQLETLPLARGLRALCARLGLAPEALALGGGEEYQLLFCLSAGPRDTGALARRLGCRVSEIGRIRRAPGVALFRDGTQVSPPRRGYEHFKPPPARADK